MEELQVGPDWVLVERRVRAQVTLVPERTVWLAYHAHDEAPRRNFIAIKLLARTRSTFAPRTDGEGLWIRADGARVGVRHQRTRVIEPDPL